MMMFDYVDEDADGKVIKSVSNDVPNNTIQNLIEHPGLIVDPRSLNTVEPKPPSCTLETTTIKIKHNKTENKKFILLQLRRS